MFRLPPSHIHAVLRSAELVSDLNSNKGRMLSLAYQVRDAFGDARVSSSGVQIIPVLEYITNKPPSQPTQVQLAECGSFSATTGIGDCTVEVATSLFPAAGSASAFANVKLMAMFASSGGGIESTTAEIQLTPPPTHPPLLEIGVLGTSPIRPLRPGEAFVVSVEASTGSVALKEWFLPVFYDSAALSFVDTTQSQLWNPLILTDEMRDMRGGEQTSAQLEVVAVSPIGMLAVASRAEVFNTAVLDGVNQTSTISATIISSWHETSNASPQSPRCGKLIGLCLAPNGDDAFMIEPASEGCTVTVAASHTVGVRQIAVVVEDGNLTASLPITVWFPQSLELVVADPVLNRIMPSEDVQQGCTQYQYQGTSVTARAAWGGEGLDTIESTDVTSLVAFESSSPNIVKVTGAQLQGLQGEGSAVISTLAPGSVNVTNDQVCVISMDAVAYTGVVFSQNPSSDISRYQPQTFSFTVNQVLVKEASKAGVRVYATFSDGQITDVTSDSQIISTNPEYLTLPSTQLVGVFGQVAAALGSPGLCAPILQATWSVCGIALGQGNGVVSIQLPGPVVVNKLSALPTSITRAGDPAAASPIQYKTVTTLE
eukprot:scaffold343942_cov36-Prasinocladus_malaysianus.AAC.1